METNKLARANGATLLILNTIGIAIVGYGCGDMPDGVISTETDKITATTDFSLGIQLAETAGNQMGMTQSTSTIEAGGGWSLWACDTDCFGPDSARLHMTAFTQDDVQQVDFRVCLQASDGGPAHSQLGTPGCTEWASTGSSSTGLVVDSDSFDPDSLRVQIETQPWPNNQDKHREVRFRMRAWDKGGGSTWHIGTWTPWTPKNTQGSGSTGWTSGPLVRDPDGFEIEMEVTETSLESFCTPTHRCERGFGDCDTNNDCASDLTCLQNVGASFGYSDPFLDVCN